MILLNCDYSTYTVFTLILHHIMAFYSLKVIEQLWLRKYAQHTAKKWYGLFYVLPLVD